jgi:hypothetical protein
MASRRRRRSAPFFCSEKNFVFQKFILKFRQHFEGKLFLGDWKIKMLTKRRRRRAGLNLNKKNLLGVCTFLGGGGEGRLMPRGKKASSRDPAWETRHTCMHVFFYSTRRCRVWSFLVVAFITITYSPRTVTHSSDNTYTAVKIVHRWENSFKWLFIS